nr:hypothetical protein [Methylonatrum kenyense]
MEAARPKIKKAAYKQMLKTGQLDLLRLQQALYAHGGRAIVNVEGMDAAGKGGAILRLVRRIDPRGYKVYRIGAPAPWEQSRHYLYRFWSRLPGPGELVIFDRSWFGRVLVERVERLASKAEWQRAYAEINAFERMLVDDGVALVKLWFHIGADEQLRRFRERQDNPFKRWKLTEEDWRNREQWDAYIEAAEEMFRQTSTDHAPWTLIAANDKRHARLEALRAVVESLEAGMRQQGHAVPSLTSSRQ